MRQRRCSKTSLKSMLSRETRGLPKELHEGSVRGTKELRMFWEIGIRGSPFHRDSSRNGIQETLKEPYHMSSKTRHIVVHVSETITL